MYGKYVSWRALIIAAGLVAAAAMLTACGSSSSKATGTTSGSSGANASKPVKFAFLLGSSDSFGEALQDGVKQEVAKTPGVTVNYFNANSDPTAQTSQCEDAISSHKYQGLLIDAAVSPAAVPCVLKAVAAGLKVVAVNNPIGPSYSSLKIQTPGVSAQIWDPISTDVQSTVKLVEAACKGLNPCQVGMLVAVPAITYSSYKLSQEKAAFAKTPNIKVVGSAVTGFDAPSVGATATQSLLSAHPGINVIASDNDVTLQGAVRLKQNGRIPAHVKLIGDGGQCGAISFVKQGLEYGTFFYAPVTEGAAGADRIVKILRGQPVGNPIVLQSSLVPGGISGVDKGNVAKVHCEYS